jgi:hypothetical protein
MNGALAATFAVLGVGLLAFGCSSPKSTDFGSLSMPSGPTQSGDAGGADDASVFVPEGDGGTFVIPQGTEAGGTITSICTPGVYRGQFMTLVGAGIDGGGASPLFSLSWNGALSIDLAAKKVVVMSGNGNGESFGTDMSLLEITDGGALEGGDMYGGSFYATLDGELDCAPDAGPPYHLAATLSDGRYMSAFYNLPIAGQLTADYQASSPPTLTNGQIFVYSPDAGFVASAQAGGTWTATWVSP